jgi:hypothetical protein
MLNENKSSPITIHPPTPRQINRWNRMLWEGHDGSSTLPTKSKQLQRSLQRFRKRRSDLFATANGQAALGEARKTQKPQQSLAAHAVTRQLRDFGVTDAQLQSMRFRKIGTGLPFNQWSVASDESIPKEAIPLLTAYCALKGLILEDPPASRDKDDAWQHVSNTMFAPVFSIGLKMKEAQSKRAKRPRGKMTDDGKTTGQLIEELSLSRQYRGETAEDLWLHFRDLLDKKGYHPQELENSKDPQQQRAYKYKFTSQWKTTSFGYFKNVVSRSRIKFEARKTKKSH